LSLTLQLPPELEAEVRTAAAKQGVAPEALAVSALAEGLHIRPVHDEPESESELLMAISEGLPEAVWRRYHYLSQRCSDELLSAEEHAEFLRLIDQVEWWNVRLLGLVIKLSKLRKVAVGDLYRDLGLSPNLNA